MIRYIAVLFFLCSTHYLIAQNDNYKVTVGVNVLNFFHKYTSAVDVVAEVRVADRFGIRVDGGPMINAVLNEDLIINKFSGWQAGLGARIYLREDPFNTYGLYLEPRVKYKTYQANIAGDFFVDNEFGFYMERNNYTVDIGELNFQIGFGQVFQFDQFRMDLVVGLGRPAVNADYKDVPDDAEFSTNGARIWQPDQEYNARALRHLIFFEWIVGYSF